MQLLRYVKTFALTLTICLLAACGTAPKQSASTQNTMGGYLVPKGSPYYKAEEGNLYAFDGTRWYVLRAPENNAGYVGGVNVGSAERWVAFGESEVKSYARTPATFRDQTLKPVFIAY